MKLEYGILAVVGTVSSNIEGIPFIPAPDILAEDGIDRIDEFISRGRGL